jgi:hypothetical protein
MSVVIYMTLWDVARFGDFLVWACPTCEKIRSVYSLNTHRYVSADFGRCFVMLCCRMAVIKSSQVKGRGSVHSHANPVKTRKTLMYLSCPRPDSPARATCTAARARPLPMRPSNRHLTAVRRSLAAGTLVRHAPV